MFGSVPQKLKEQKAAEQEDEQVADTVEEEKTSEKNNDEPEKFHVPDLELEEDDLSKKRKEKIYGYLPAIHEWRNDLSRHYEASSVKLGPISLEHLSNESIYESLQTSQHFQIRLKRLAPTDDFIGHITVSFENEDKAELSSSTLIEACPDVTVKHTKPIDGKSIDVSDIIKPERQLHVTSTPPINNVIVLSRLIAGISEEDIRNEFPTAKSILIPKDGKTDDPRLYAYVELPTQADVEKLDGKSIPIGKGENKRTIQLYKLKRYPPIATVIKKLENEKDLFSSKCDVHQLPYEKKEELLELYRLGCHYERSLYISEKKKEIVAENMKQFRKKVPNINILKSKKPRYDSRTSRTGSGYGGFGGNRRSRGSMGNYRRGGSGSQYLGTSMAF